jgi:hypothetical protein
VNLLLQCGVIGECALDQRSFTVDHDVAGRLSLYRVKRRIQIHNIKDEFGCVAVDVRDVADLVSYARAFGTPYA